MDGGESGPQAFRPEVFFTGRTRGWGVVRVIGGQNRRCTIATRGHIDDAYDSLRFDENFAFEDGEVQEWRWAMTRQRDGRYVAAEALAGAGIMGRMDRGDYVLSFSRPLRPEGGFPTPRYETRFTAITSLLAMKRTRVSILGLTVANLTAFHERVG